MLIEEDADEERCSPIKPKKRTQIDSPFKRDFEADSDNSSNYGQCCGDELDRRNPLSLNLNIDNVDNDQIVVTPKKGEQNKVN